VAGGQGLVQDVPADPAGRREDGELHLPLPAGILSFAYRMIRG
jgi:hypothetical protein